MSIKVEVTAYCMKCRAKRKMKDPTPIVHSNGKDAITGKCSVCGTKVFRMGKMPGANVAPPAADQSSGKKKKKGGGKTLVIQ